MNRNQKAACRWKRNERDKSKDEDGNEVVIGLNGNDVALGLDVGTSVLGAAA
jgi:hypothetical protein